jgi:hypothetical protein
MEDTVLVAVRMMVPYLFDFQQVAGPPPELPNRLVFLFFQRIGARAIGA